MIQIIATRDSSKSRGIIELLKWALELIVFNQRLIKITVSSNDNERYVMVAGIYNWSHSLHLRDASRLAVNNVPIYHERYASVTVVTHLYGRMLSILGCALDSLNQLEE